MKKGFTLIELLAVIVILALIAVIAVPVVINIIENAKTSARQRSIDNYIHAVELEISQNILKGNKLSDGYHNIEMFDVEVKGEIPDYGYIEIKDGKIVNYHVSIDNKPYSDAKVELGKNEDNKKTNETKIDPMKAVSELSIDWVNQEIIKGISFSFEDTLTFNFYIDKNKINGEKIYLKGTHASRYNPADSIEQDKKNYKENNKYIIFSYNNFTFQEFTNDIKFEIIDNEGHVLDTINYNLSLYANNKIYKTENEFEKKVLISLMNLGASNQLYFDYETENLANKVLNDEDKNLGNPTQDALNLYNRVSTESIDLENNIGQYFVDNAIKVSNSSYASNNFIGSPVRIKKTTPFSEEEIDRYGVLIFDEENYNYLKTKGIENFNIEYNNLYDVINRKNNRVETRLTSATNSYSIYFYYRLPMAFLSNNFYIIPYYIDSDGVYKYGKLLQYNVILNIKKTMDSKPENQNLQAVSYLFLDFCELIRL